MTDTSTVDSHVSTDRRDSPPTLYDLSRPEITADPWQWYAHLRALGPVVRDRATGSWLVTRHADVTAVLADKARFTVFMDHKARASQAPAAMRQAFFYLDRIIAFVDAPDHSRQRSALAGPFTRPNVQDLNHLVTGLVDAALDRVATSGRMDVVADLAARIPLQVISHLLGCDQTDDEVDLDTLRRWSAAWGTVVAAPGHIPAGPSRDRVLADVDDLIAYLKTLVAAHRAAPRVGKPRDTVTSALVRAADAGVLDEDELVGNLMMLLAAGNETTTNLISNTVAALIDHPWLPHQLRGQPDLVPQAVEELARRDPPNQYTARIACTDVDLHGHRIPAGQSVVLMLAAANRDPAAFPDPDALKLDRPTTPRHVGFGHGAHYCFGAPLARLETQQVLARVLTRCPDLQPTGPRRWRGNPNLRGLAELPVRFGPAATPVDPATDRKTP
jgi:cytochrome P450